MTALPDPGQMMAEIRRRCQNCGHTLVSFINLETYELVPNVPGLEYAHMVTYRETLGQVTWMREEMRGTRCPHPLTQLDLDIDVENDETIISLSGVRYIPIQQ